MLALVDGTDQPGAVHGERRQTWVCLPRSVATITTLSSGACHAGMCEFLLRLAATSIVRWRCYGAWIAGPAAQQLATLHRAVQVPAGDSWRCCCRRPAATIPLAAVVTHPTPSRWHVTAVCQQNAFWTRNQYRSCVAAACCRPPGTLFRPSCVTLGGSTVSDNS